jgi:hypothetical protein
MPGALWNGKCNSWYGFCEYVDWTFAAQLFCGDGRSEGSMADVSSEERGGEMA